MKKWSRPRLAEACLLGFSLLCGLLLIEAAIRCVDGYSVTSLRLVKTGPPAIPPTIVMEEHLRQAIGRIPIAAGVDPAWFDINPTELRTGRTPDPDMASRYWSHPGHELPSIYIWNKQFVEDEVCAGREFMGGMSDVFVFDPVDNIPRPRYRFPQNSFLPSGLVTNEFGWRGPPVSLNRGPRTIRIAFVGASTTVNEHGYPFSYPEHVGEWLNRWSREANLGVRFEIINAGREGTNSDDFAAVVRQELLPLDPDFVIYYEGSNQFWPAAFVEWPGRATPLRPVLNIVEPELLNYSAVARRAAPLLMDGREGGEPRKSFGTVKWPPTLSERDPDLSSRDLPLNLPVILHDLEQIDSDLKQSGGELIPSSFVWMVYDGMVLDLPRQHLLFEYLNDTFGRFTYAHMRRMADFQNEVLRKFARIRGLPFIDVSGNYPRDTNFFNDAIHMNSDGIRLHAWIVFQQLVPIANEGLRSGRLPRAIREPPLERHPAFSTSVTLVQIQDLKQQCGAVGSKE